jgi:hypothetical protein
MPENQTLARVRADKRQGKAPSTQAGEFVKEEMDHIREGVHGARSTKQAIAIGLSKARRAGVDLPPPKPGKTAESTRKQAARDLERGHESPAKGNSPKRSRATLNALKHEERQAASPTALARHAHAASKARSPAERSEAAQQAARTRERAKSDRPKESGGRQQRLPNQKLQSGS